MDSESQAALILSQVEAEGAALEHAVRGYEQAVARVEQCMEEVEQVVQANTARDDSCLQPVTQALRASQEAATLVDSANAVLDAAMLQARTIAQTTTPLDDYLPLPDNTLICDGRYRLVYLLHRRPRVHLYLARRVDDLPAAAHKQSLVAIRELVLTGLAPEERRSIIRGAFEEFAAPRFFGSPHLPGVGDHLHIEGTRHYLIMQPRPVRGNKPIFALPLLELLPGQPGSPAISTWPDLPAALHLGIQLCHVIARLHSMKTILGELTPAMVLVNRAGSADWAPLLLASWATSSPLLARPGRTGGQSDLRAHFSARGTCRYPNPGDRVCC